MESFDVEKGSFVLGNIIKASNKKKMVKNFIIEHDKVYNNLDNWMSHVPNDTLVRDCDKHSIDRANKNNYLAATR